MDPLAEYQNARQVPLETGNSLATCGLTEKAELLKLEA
jgi:hypothetical protein